MTNHPRHINGDEFDSPEERAECDEQLIALDRSLSVAARRTWGEFDVCERWRFWRHARQYAREGYDKHGIHDGHALAKYVSQRLESDQKCGNVAVLLLLASILWDVVWFFIERWLDRRAPVGGREAGDASR